MLDSSLCQNCITIQMFKNKRCIKCAENREHVHHLEKYDCCLCGQSKPFSSFYKPSLCGSCLNLNIAKHLAHSSGGSINVDPINKSIIIHTNQSVIPMITPNVKITSANHLTEDRFIEFTPAIYLYPEIYAQHNALKYEYEKLKEINQQLIAANINLTLANKQLHREVYFHEFKNKDNIVSNYMSI
jgi:hypothetical protein